jgi:hypothetical protein
MERVLACWCAVIISGCREASGMVIEYVIGKDFEAFPYQDNDQIFPWG